MFFKYSPDGNEPQVWHYVPGDLRTTEIEAIEDVTGMPYGGEFKLKLLQGNARARRALLWTFLRRIHPTLEFHRIDFADKEVTLELDREEIASELEALADADGMKAEDRITAEAIFRRQLETAPPAPKAPSPTSVESTPSA